MILFKCNLKNNGRKHSSIKMTVLKPKRTNHGTDIQNLILPYLTDKEDVDYLMNMCIKRSFSPKMVSNLLHTLKHAIEQFYITQL